MKCLVSGTIQFLLTFFTSFLAVAQAHPDDSIGAISSMTWAILISGSFIAALKDWRTYTAQPPGGNNESV